MLDEVRPYLIADGGNVRVMGVDVESRVVSDLLTARSLGITLSEKDSVVFAQKISCRCLQKS